MISVVTFICALSTVGAFVHQSAPKASSALFARSKSIPFGEQPAALDGSMAGDVGFDPIGFSGMWADKDWSQQVVPDIWPETTKRTPITTLEWMREAELKHGRVCMLATLGWVAVDSGLRFPVDGFSNIPNSLAAHNAAVENGSMGFLLLVVGVMELVSGAALFDQAKGSGRNPGDFAFDPLNFSKDTKAAQRY
ncbi:chlorophyll a/b-binding protein domain-containing protein, partial [Ochromonadaceae sp. CCMP2298]